MIVSLISGLFSLGGQWLSNRREKAQAKHEREIKVIQGEQDWDMIQAQSAATSWKDEWLTIFFTGLLLPGVYAVLWDDSVMLERWKTMFIVLQNDVPQEYWLILSVIVAASFGVKKVMEGIQAIRGGPKS